MSGVSMIASASRLLVYLWVTSADPCRSLSTIPLLLFYTFLQTKTTEMIDSLEMATVRFVNLLIKHKNAMQANS